MTAFLPVRSLRLVSLPWLSASLAVSTMSLAVVGAMSLRRPPQAPYDLAMGAEMVIAFAPIVTRAEQAPSQASPEATPNEQEAKPETEAVRSRPDQPPDQPVEQASSTEAEAPDLRMARDRTREESETAPAEAQTTEAAEAQTQIIQATASAASDALVAPQPEERSVAPDLGDAREAQRRIEAWQRAIFAHIARFKTYPEEARKRRQQGEVVVIFQLARDGRVSAARAVSGSGSTLLDQAAVAVLAKASPLPAPPAELSGAFLELRLPIRYELR